MKTISICTKGYKLYDSIKANRLTAKTPKPDRVITPKEVIDHPSDEAWCKITYRYAYRLILSWDQKDEALAG